MSLQQLGDIYGVERDDDGARRVRHQSPAEQLEIINRHRARKGLPPLEK